MMSNGDYQNQTGFNGKKQTIREMKEYFAADSTSYFSSGTGMQHDNGYSPMYFRYECQANAGRFIFVIAGSLPKLFICFRQELVIHDSSAIALLKTSLPGIPATLPVR